MYLTNQNNSCSLLILHTLFSKSSRLPKSWLRPELICDEISVWLENTMLVLLCCKNTISDLIHDQRVMIDSGVSLCCFGFSWYTSLPWIKELTPWCSTQTLLDWCLLVCVSVVCYMKQCCSCSTSRHNCLLIYESFSSHVRGGFLVAFLQVCFLAASSSSWKKWLLPAVTTPKSTGNLSVAQS